MYVEDRCGFFDLFWEFLIEMLHQILSELIQDMLWYFLQIVGKDFYIFCES